MAQSYRQITWSMARHIRLIVTDIDGTLTEDTVSLPGSAIFNVAIRLQEAQINMGLISGRTLPEVESLAASLGIGGPIIAENGGVAKYKIGGELVNLGYSRDVARKNLQKLKRLFPNIVQEREDNRDRLVDVVFWASGIRPEELAKYIEDVDAIDSGYRIHLVPKGVNKGKTLMKILENTADGRLSPDNVIVFGDSSSDLSLFQLFQNSVLVLNPIIPFEQRQMLEKAAKYTTNLPCGEGFVEVASHILNLHLNHESYV